MTAAGVFADRRRRLAQRFQGPCAFCAGFSRVKNFPHNRFPFRAESHFLYLVGRSLEGALLVLGPGQETLYVEAPDPKASLWTGHEPGLLELQNELGIETQLLSELKLPENAATLPPQDTDSALWLSELLQRPIEPGGGDCLTGADSDLADAMIATRLIHDDAAIEQLRQAAEVGQQAHTRGMQRTRAGISEAAVAAAMLEAIYAAGMRTSYNPIVTMHGEVLHNQRHDGVLEPGELLLADVGAETMEGWASDITRTWPVSGCFSPTQRAIYEAVLSAQLCAIEQVKPNVQFSDVHHAAGRSLLSSLMDLGLLRGDKDDLYERGAAALFFPHGVGHLLGLDVHDMEDLGDRAGYGPGRRRRTTKSERFLRLGRVLKPGMVVTIEPGFYLIQELLNDAEHVGDLQSALNRKELAKYADVRGVRIEDDVLVTSNSAEVLTSELAKTPDAVEAMTSS